MLASSPDPSMLSCVVVDTETTGIRSAQDRVIEIGAVRIVEGCLEERFETFVNPGIPVPRRITRLTGIRTAHLVDAPGPDEAWSRFVEFASDAVLVAHNARFDRSFIDAELCRAGIESRATGWLCTVRLSRRLLPGMPSHRLDAVARMLGIPVGVRHRALADAEITARVLLELVRRADTDELAHIEDLVAFQGTRYTSKRHPNGHLSRLRSLAAGSLPDAPGVYRLLDGRGKVLYVGKATSLRDRVGSYFVGVEAKGARIRDLVRHVRSFEVDRVATEIEARVREFRLILDLVPPYNRAQTEPGRRRWIRISKSEPRSTLAVTRFRGAGNCTWIGPLATGSDAAGLVEVLGIVCNLDVERRSARSPRTRAAERRMAGALERLASAVAGARGPADWTAGALLDAARGPIETAMQEASSELAFEDARILRDWLEALERLADEAGVASPLAGEAVAVRHVDDGCSELVAIRNGRLLGSMVAVDDIGDWVIGTFRGTAIGPDSEARDGPRERRARVDEAWMLGRWIRRSGARLVERVPGEDLTKFGSRVREEVATTGHVAESVAEGVVV